MLAARDIRETFKRMGLGDEETVALIAGGHTFGKTHGPAEPNATCGPEPEAAPLTAQGLGWAGEYGSGIAADTVTSGLEGMWTRTPVEWDHTFFETLFEYKWDVELSPAGLWQWIPADGQGEGTVPDPFDPDTKHHPVMLTTDLALQEDRAFEAISRRFLDHPDQFEDAFARAWFKLTHIDMGPIQRYLGPLVPAERLIWQDPVPGVDHELVDAGDVAALKREILGSGLTVAQLVATAWASASTYRDSDKRGGANGARIRLEPQRGWEVNDPSSWHVVLPALEAIQERFNASQAGRQADLDGRPDRARRVCRGGTRRRGRRSRGRRSVPPRAHRRDPGMDRRRVVRGVAAQGGRLPELPGRPLRRAVRAAAGGSGEPADVERAGDDGAGRRAAGARSQPQRVPGGGADLVAGSADERLLRQPAGHGDEVGAEAGRGHPRGDLRGP